MQAESTAGRKRDLENHGQVFGKRIKSESFGSPTESTSHGFRPDPDNSPSLELGSRTAKNDSDYSYSKEFRKSDNEVGMSNKAHRFESGLMTFPEKLMMLLDGNCVKDAMWWLPDGDAFCFIPNVFAEQVLDKHFQGTKFESFTRKLNRWGFKRVAGQKVPTNAVAYYHNSFTRGRPDMIKTMTGGKMKTEKKSRPNTRVRSDSIQTANTRQSDARSQSPVVLRSDPSDNSHAMQTASPHQVRSGVSSLSSNQVHPNISSLISNRVRGNQELMDQSRLLNVQRRFDGARDAAMNADLNMLLLSDRNSPLISDLATRILVGRTVGFKTGEIAPGGGISGLDSNSLTSASDFLLAQMLSQRGLDPSEHIFSSNSTSAPTGSSNLGGESNILSQLLSQNAARTGPLLPNSALLLSQRLGTSIPNHPMNLNLANIGRGDTINETNAVKLANLVSAQQNGQHGGFLGTVRPNTAGMLNWNTGLDRSSDSERDVTREQLLRAYLMEQQQRSLQQQQHLGGVSEGSTGHQDQIGKKIVTNNRGPC